LSNSRGRRPSRASSPNSASAPGPLPRTRPLAAVTWSWRAFRCTPMTGCHRRPRRQDRDRHDELLPARVDGRIAALDDGEFDIQCPGAAALAYSRVVKACNNLLPNSLLTLAPALRRPLTAAPCPSPAMTPPPRPRSPELLDALGYDTVDVGHPRRQLALRTRQSGLPAAVSPGATAPGSQPGTIPARAMETPSVPVPAARVR